MAAAFVAAKGTFGSSAVCYGCGKPSHFKKDCFAWKRAKSKAPDVCPRCWKGRRFANQCRSKCHSEGCPIQGNRSQGTGRRHTPTQIPQLPMQIQPPQIPAPQVQPPRMPSRGQPHVFA
ncbi:GAK5 protein, partial [Pomatorhinus ruficollis]|nr:GAK5 protein [Pomatorhinus ruficollis]